MIELPQQFRWATPDDSDYLVEYVNAAGEGLPYYLWQQMAGPGQSAWDVGRERARRDSGGFSYRNAVLRVEGDKVVAGLIGYPLDDTPPRHDYSQIPPMFVPLQKLEDLVPGTWHVNVIAACSGDRGKGYGTELLNLACQFSMAHKKRGLSLIVSDSNKGARRFYNRLGFRELGTRGIVKEQWQYPGKNWILMAKEVGDAGIRPSPDRQEF